MTTLTVWKFDSTSGAQAAQERLLDLARQGVITVHDAATVTWEVGAKKPETAELVPTTGAGALGGAFWGLLMFGLSIFFVPLLAVPPSGPGHGRPPLGGVSLTDFFVEDRRHLHQQESATRSRRAPRGAVPGVSTPVRRQAARQPSAGINQCGAPSSRT